MSRRPPARYRPPDPEFDDSDDGDELEELGGGPPARRKWIQLSFGADMLVFLLLFWVIDTSWIVALIVSQLVGWSIRGAAYALIR